MKNSTTYGWRSAVPALTLLMMLTCARFGAAQEVQAVAEDPNESLAAIRAAAHDYIKSLLPASSGESTVKVGELDNRLRLAHCPGRNLSAALPAGATLQARVTHWTVYVPAVVESKINVLVLVRAVNREARLSPADVTIETRTTAGPGTAYLTSLPELAGRTVRRPLPSGTALAVDMFVTDMVVRRGQQVTLLSAGGMIEVRANGRAMADGSAGARIQVQNLNSMRIVEGVVESSELVRVAR
jgi:flagellar basal body P-ring formation protein FlgA